MTNTALYIHNTQISTAQPKAAHIVHLVEAAPVVKGHVADESLTDDPKLLLLVSSHIESSIAQLSVKEGTPFSPPLSLSL